MARYSFVAVDHRGHGRGIRSDEHFRLEDAADDAAGVVRTLDCGPVIVVGYSMGGPLALQSPIATPTSCGAWCWKRPPCRSATTRFDRMLVAPAVGHGDGDAVALRCPVRPAPSRKVRRRRDSDIGPLVPWLAAEMGRGDPTALTRGGLGRCATSTASPSPARLSHARRRRGDHRTTARCGRSCSDRWPRRSGPPSSRSTGVTSATSSGPRRSRPPRSPPSMPLRPRSRPPGFTERSQVSVDSSPSDRSVSAESRRPFGRAARRRGRAARDGDRARSM